MNNLAFSLAKLGRADAARAAFDRIDPKQLNDHQKVTWLATSGLIKYREGRSDEGRRLYREAMMMQGTREPSLSPPFLRRWKRSESALEIPSRISDG